MQGTILLIAVLWLVLLSPLLLRNRRPVRRTAEALNETRVLHSGDSAAEGAAVPAKRMQTLRKLKPARVMHEHSDDDVLELVEAEPEYIVFDDESTSASSRPALGATEELEEEALEEEPVVDGEVVEGELEEVEPSSGSHRFSHDETDTGEFPPVKLVEDKPEITAPAEPLGELPTAYLRGGDIDTRVPLDDEYEEPQLSSAEDDYLSQDLGEVSDANEATEEDLAFVKSRQGRGVYDPEASQRLVQQRLRRRAQVLTAMVVLTVLTAAAGVIMGGKAWIAFAAMFVFTAIYLVALRHHAVEERRLRRRRLARMRRSRLGVRNREDEELGIPQRLLRPGGVILEVDDMDPELHNLGYIDSRDYFDYEPETHHDQHARAV